MDNKNLIHFQYEHNKMSDTSTLRSVYHVPNIFFVFVCVLEDIYLNCLHYKRQIWDRLHYCGRLCNASDDDRNEIRQLRDFKATLAIS